MAGCNDCRGPGSVAVVGTGPGSIDHITPQAVNAIAAADIVVGYKTYLDLIPQLLEGKEVLSSQMMQEVDRCRKAVELADTGKKVALICGGDPGIYAMAGLIYEVVMENAPKVKVEIIPGLAALNSCAARLGAPLMHDFAAISLSDLLTPMALIEKRLDAAAMADFVLVIYNPKSKKRTSQLLKAQEIALKYRKADTPVGIVTAATRENETIVLTTLGELDKAEVGMQSTVIIGNSTTFTWQGVMITPRGYHNKYKIGE
ncbi:MAG: precorrin-3B C(17)-methyltransferase [Proteobacteria bacterium]|nr:precorrin-3B C(17)-methyltransferase [Pseudomonadota bacterium]MBU1639151.1 precorrin-3B C(17)-methyltransferase [Pseudomonadota bacterium]